MRLTTCLNLLQRSLILGSFNDYIHCIYICRDGCNLRTLAAGIKALNRICFLYNQAWHFPVQY